MADKRNKYPDRRAGNTDVASFIEKLASTPATKPSGERGRLVFAMDATASRAPTWHHARDIQSRMFAETAALGGLDIQLVYYRGLGEFDASPWYHRSEDLLAYMEGVSCLGGHTQIERVLQHTQAEWKKQRVNALVFVGDCCEEDVDRLCHVAGQLGVQGVPVFLFHEGHDPVAALAFEHIAKLTKGACCPFDAGSPQQLRELLSAVAVYAAGGRRALQDYSRRTGGATLLLTRQLEKSS